MTTIDFDAYYTARGFEGCALYLAGWATEEVEVLDFIVEADPDDPWAEDEYHYVMEERERDDMVLAVMVGDDQRHEIDVDDLIPLRRGQFCAGCGQVGCGHDGYDDEEDE